MEKKWNFGVWAKANAKKIIYGAGSLIAIIGIGFLVAKSMDKDEDELDVEATLTDEGLGEVVTEVDITE